MEKTKEKYLKSFVESMRDSYPSLTIQFAEAEYDKLMNGEKPTNVIGMFMESDLQERGIIYT